MMKKLEELGISTAPWKVAVHIDRETGEPYKNINDADGRYVCDGTTDPDKCMLAAAPELYEALHEAVGESCLSCPHDCANCINLNHNWIPKAKAALAKAGGEEVKDER